MTQAGWLSAFIREEYGGAGLPLSAAAAILEEMQCAGCNAGTCHAQMYTLLRHGSETQKQKYLPSIAGGSLRLQAFGVTELTSGTDTGVLKTTAKLDIIMPQYMPCKLFKIKPILPSWLYGMSRVDISANQEMIKKR